jgi:hypothetical protein
MPGTAHAAVIRTQAKQWVPCLRQEWQEFPLRPDPVFQGATEHALIRRVDDGVDGKLRDVALH